MDDKEIFDLVRQSYASANADYISEQIRIASQNLPDIKQEGATAMGGFLNFIKEYSSIL